MNGSNPVAARPTILCAAFSARQIAESARLSGFDALAVDFFADHDLTAASRKAALLASHFPDGFSDADLLAALDGLAEGEAPVGFVYGAGFEDRPALLRQICERWPLLGTDAASSAKLKDPDAFALLCREAGVAHPQIAGERGERPGDGRWVSKQVGGCGGSHVRWAGEGSPEPANDAARRYVQRFVEGERWSLAFLGCKGAIAIIGFSRQWADPGLDEPFRYGGAVGPIDPPERVREAIERGVADLVRTAFENGVHVTGLASADFVVTRTQAVCLELNARFGATVDVFDSARAPLFAAHLAACRGALPDGPWPRAGRVRAAGLAWASGGFDLGEDFAWPHWCRDRSSLPRSYEAGEPIATVCADADTEGEAAALFFERAAMLNDPDARGRLTEQLPDQRTASAKK
ncbi:ATP-grasp domain-containing protein [Fulvimarina sp. 2208YS6-2-32]|uniref:ATP-grasp domain-containing protein n=1 Tax=Fulvimarina uroteuthidis TaxID=3098149 RepID=A0ABU5HZT7_9HYPH|nr:ATP-grasp domain-containing protein [Fulvimarina sp. 2208YS6-2-32]MDY8108099.1 ATP-grasp domain-containing protein [Fulvimarina sp. 2208YS6-2-32]